MAQQVLTGGNGTSGQTGLQVRTMINENFTEIYGGDADYVIEKISTITYARPRRSGLTAYSNSNSHTVIQAAITALTPAGAVGTGGGKIHIKSGTYSLTDELVITGWEASGGPYSQLTIEGAGWSTWLFQATAAKNCLIVKNKAGVVLKNFKATSTERSALLLDSTGTSEQSVWFSTLDNLVLESSSTTHPAVYLKNFMNLHVGFLKIGNPNYHGLIMENDSVTTFYGNSSFDHIKLFVSASHAGMLVQSTNTTRWLDHCNFGYFEVGQGLYGIRTSYAQDFCFGVLDIEQVTNCISLGTLGTTTSNNTYGWTVTSGYLLPLTGGTSIHCSQYAGGNVFTNVWIDGDATSIPISDDQQFFNPNSYDVNLGWDVDPTNIDITEDTLTFLRYRLNNGYTTHTKFPTNTVHQQLNLAAMNAAPASASDTGTTGEIRITATHLYVCTATDTWVRTALATWP